MSVWTIDSWQETMFSPATRQRFTVWFARVERQASKGLVCMQVGEGRHVDREEAVRMAVTAARKSRDTAREQEQHELDADKYDRTTPAEQVGMSMHGAI